LSDLNFLKIFKSIWLEPRATIQHIIENNPTKHVITFAILATIVLILSGTQGIYILGEDTLKATVISTIIGGIIGGIFNLYMVAYFLQLTGRWLGGTASREHIRCATAWAMLPLIPVLAIWCFWLVYFGENVFILNSEAITTAPGAFIYLFTTIPVFICSIWSFFISLKALSQVQGFSAWKAIVNFILAGILCGLVVVAAGYIFIFLAKILFAVIYVAAIS